MFSEAYEILQSLYKVSDPFINSIIVTKSSGLIIESDFFTHTFTSIPTMLEYLEAINK